MKKVLMLSICLPIVALAQSGRLFNVSYQAQNGILTATLTTNIPNRSYINAGMTLPAGFSFVNGSCPNQQGQTCVFSINHTSPVTIKFYGGPTGSVVSKLCLNQSKALNCEYSTVRTRSIVTALAMGGEENGVIYSSQNNIDWTSYTTGFNQHQFKASYCDNYGQHCIAGGFKGTNNNNFVPAAFTSSDYGVTWNQSNTTQTTSGISTDFPIQFWDMSCVESTGFCVAGGNAKSSPQSYLWYSQDYGVTWSQPYQEPVANSYRTLGTSCYHSISANQDKCIVLSGVNNYAVTAAGNANFPIIFTTYAAIGPFAGYNFIPMSISCADNDRCVVAGYSEDAADNRLQSAKLFYSTDGGAIWNQSQIANPGPSDAQVVNLSSVSCDSTGLRCIAGGWYSTDAVQRSPAQGLVYTTSDGGVNWNQTVILPSPRSDLTTIRLNAGKCSPYGTCYVAGHAEDNGPTVSYPISYVSHDYGQTWSSGTLLPFPANVTNNRENLFTIALFQTIQVF